MGRQNVEKQGPWVESRDGGGEKLGARKQLVGR